MLNTCISIETWPETRRGVDVLARPLHRRILPLMSERREGKPERLGGGSPRVNDASEDVPVAPISTETETRASLAVEVLKRAETMLSERERTAMWLQVAASLAGVLVGAAVAIRGIVADSALYAILTVASTGIVALVAAAVATDIGFGFWPFRAPPHPSGEPELPKGLAALRDRLAAERHEALARVHQSRSTHKGS
jgi:hypothetical protein